MTSVGPTTTDPTETGTIAACRRYPVKSFQGIEVDHLDIGPAGVAGDRAHGLIDRATGRLLTAKRVAALLGAAADDDGFTLPDGSRHRFGGPGIDETLSAWLDRPVHLATVVAGVDTGAGSPLIPDPASRALSYQMTFDPPDDGAELFDIPVPLGTFLDLAAVHLVTTATLRGVAAARPDLDWDVRRFRPNLVVDVDGPAFVEQSWTGRDLRVGSAVLSVLGPTVRCAMPLRAQPGGLERQPELFRAMSELNESFPNHLGLYCGVVTPGRMEPGDPVALV